jgi:hypothetical protein
MIQPRKTENTEIRKMGDLGKLIDIRRGVSRGSTSAPCDDQSTVRVP